MGDRKFTLLEFHLHSDDGGIQFGPRAMGTEAADGNESEEDTASASATETETGSEASSGGSRIAPLVGAVAFLAIAGYVVRRLRSVADVDDEGGEAIEVEV